MYTDDDMLMLSGIQHFRFCQRQWALIHIEQQWDDNHLTIEGQLLHRRVDDPFYRQKCGDEITLRSVSLASHELGLYGIADVVELLPTDDARDSITHPRYPGRWLPRPVEYKHGRPKRDETDEVQLAAQAMCLEEMYGIHIREAAFFYAEARRRTTVAIDDGLRATVRQCAEAMHRLMRQGKIPSAEHEPKCKRCSLLNLCMPGCPEKTTAYLAKHLFRDEETA